MLKSTVIISECETEWCMRVYFGPLGLSILVDK